MHVRVLGLTDSQTINAHKHVRTHEQRAFVETQVAEVNVFS
jgi:hypothetical protein